LLQIRRGVQENFSMTSLAFFGIVRMGMILFSPFLGGVYGPEGENNRILWEGMM
jgi:hypothetical protein